MAKRGRPRKVPVEIQPETTAGGAAVAAVAPSPTADVAKKKKLTAREEVDRIRHKMKHFTFTPDAHQVLWFQHPDAYVRSTFGSKEFGIRFGRIVSISGAESHGKTTVVCGFAGEAQHQNIPVGWVDFENSADDSWFRMHGADPDEIALFDYQTVTEKKDLSATTVKPTDLHILTAEELLQEAEQWVERKYLENPNRGIIMVWDSIAAILSDAEEDAGLDDRRTTMLSQFMSKALRRWQSICASRNVMLLMINQLREKPGMAYGDPLYEPGGRAVRHYPSVKVRVRRIMGKKGSLTKAGVNIGFKGILTNQKNKSGGGSQEGVIIGFKMYKSKPTKFVDVKEVKTDESE